MYFEFKNDKSNKFWEIDYINNKKIYVKYGKIGGKGTYKEFDFDSSYDANNFFEKKQSEKLSKGYTNVEPLKPSVKVTKPSFKAKKSSVKTKKPSVKTKKPFFIVKKQCPSGKILNPKTNRCIKDKTLKNNKIMLSNNITKLKIKTITNTKKCPPGKIFNAPSEYSL